MRLSRARLAVSKDGTIEASKALLHNRAYNRLKYLLLGAVSTKDLVKAVCFCLLLRSNAITHIASLLAVVARDYLRLAALLLLLIRGPASHRHLDIHRGVLTRHTCLLVLEGVFTVFCLLSRPALFPGMFTTWQRSTQEAQLERRRYKGLLLHRNLR